MRALLDTHALLWYLAGERDLSARARDLIDDPGNTMVVSVASLWEIAIKYGLGKLDLGLPFEDLVRDELSRTAFEILAIEVNHLITLSELPLHHRDPFDRLLIAQAISEDLPVVGTDSAFERYPVGRIW
ncbi:MAG TPA: type II toxin-antitoxin system VapC family toxin [Longimicrobium sp.]|jgi:PIN domain nuclease of toxin-antitoxin system